MTLERPTSYGFLTYLDRLDKSAAEFVWDGSDTMVAPGDRVVLSVPREIWDSLNSPTSMELHMSENRVQDGIMAELVFRALDTGETIE